MFFGNGSSKEPLKPELHWEGPKLSLSELLPIFLPKKESAQEIHGRMKCRIAFTSIFFTGKCSPFFLAPKRVRSFFFYKVRSFLDSSFPKVYGSPFF
ncbi:hypothetical protein DLM78_03520 [Leptospira stimsonii]|uniref:Uncharacterized protein n=1 Tax=Leptospira stimsonii TaxID=2202203 RepID=A0A8B3CUX3_9LEPT|nr:hypothetical protein DLM78_03520 [Leptospira stimsonii]